MKPINDIEWLSGLPQSTKTGWSCVVDYYSFLITKDFLYKLCFKQYKSKMLNVERLFCINNMANPSLLPLIPEYQFDCIYSFKPQYTYAFLTYKENEYIINLFMNVDMASDDRQFYKVNVEGIGKNSPDSFELFNEIQTSALQASPLKNKIILINNNDFRRNLLTSIELKPKTSATLSELFLPEDYYFHLERFIYEVENYKKSGQTYRYLFNGEPGNGKSQAISAIINQTYGKITTVIIQGVNYKFYEIFDFCEQLSPCLLIIDDLDFIAQDRKSSNSVNQLNDLLHALDGINSKPIFFLAATNDKRLVDVAASRPGRFDLILDFGSLDKSNFLKLIKRETEEQNILELFDSEIMDMLVEKKVTGAFIVNLIKQIKSIMKIKEVSKKEVLNLFNLAYNGFYKNNNSNSKSVGF
jgi:hypothetical protein